jgi:hypothetical protein
MWPVTDNGVWVGWLGKATFRLDGSNKASFDNFKAHLNWGGGGTGVSYDQGFMCFDCTGERLLFPFFLYFVCLQMLNSAPWKVQLRQPSFCKGSLLSSNTYSLADQHAIGTQIK